MAKYYVRSGPVRLVLEACSRRRAAVKAFQWTCEKQAMIHATTPLQLVAEAERRGWQLAEEVAVSEQGFNGLDATMFDTVNIVTAWQAVAGVLDPVV